MKPPSIATITRHTFWKVISGLLVGVLSAVATLPFYSPVAYGVSPQTFYAHSESEGYEASDNEMDQRTPEPATATYTITPSGTGDFQIPGNNSSGGRYFTAGWPSASTIPAGTWTFHTWIQRPEGTTSYYVKVFKNADATPQFTSSSVAIPTSWAETDTTGSAPAISMSAGDRLRFEYWVNVTVNTANQTTYPSSDGDISGSWTVYPSSPTTRWDKVDEDPADDDTTYIYATAIGRSLFTFSAFTVPAGSTITDLTIYFRHKEVTSASNKLGVSLKVGGTAYDNATQVNPTTTWTTSSSVYTTNPRTGAAWTVDDINGVGANALQQFGVRTSDVTPNPYCTQVYAVVNYRPPVSLRIDDNSTPDISTRVDTTVAEIVPTLGYYLVTIVILFFIFVAVRKRVLVLRPSDAT